MSSSSSLTSTGLSTLDTLLAGGMPARQSLLITGDPGTGKTILCAQIAFALAKRGLSASLATVTSEPHDKLVEELRNFSFFDQGCIGEELFIFSIYPWLQRGAKEAKDLLLKTVKDRRNQLLFIDGLRSLRDLWANEAQLRDFLYELNVGLAQANCIGLFTTEYPLQRLLEYPEATTVDGIVALSMRLRGEQLMRRAQVVKLRGRPHLQGEHVLHIDGSGIRIVPRLETQVAADPDYVPPGTRTPWGLPGLDELIQGGLPTESTTVLVGNTGVGKTLMALYFAAYVAEHGERSVFFSYSEPPGRLIARARAIGLEVESLVRTDRLRIIYNPATEVEADDLANEILRHVSETGARRLVVDGLGELESAVTNPARSRGFFTALIVALRRARVTSLFIKESTKLTSPEVDFSDTSTAVTAENLLFARHIEYRGMLRRMFSIVKMRESGFDEHLREFEITSGGIRILEPIRHAEGVLTGLARPIWDDARESGERSHG